MEGWGKGRLQPPLNESKWQQQNHNCQISPYTVWEIKHDFRIKWFGNKASGVCSLKQKLYSVFILFVLTVYFFLSYSLKLSEQVYNCVYFDGNLDFKISEREGQW